LNTFESTYERELRNGINIYEPYIIVEESNDRVLLTVSRARKFLFVFAFRFIPLFLLCMIPVLFYFYDGGIPISFIIAVAVCALITALLLFFKKVIHQVMVIDTVVETVFVKGFKKGTQQLLLQDASHIYLQVVYGKGGGAIYSLCMKDGNQHEFLVVPYLNMKKARIQMLSVRLKEITGLPMQGNFLADDYMNVEKS
jgi:hypothetical protein